MYVRGKPLDRRSASIMRPEVPWNPSNQPHPRTRNAPAQEAVAGWVQIWFQAKQGSLHHALGARGRLYCVGRRGRRRVLLQSLRRRGFHVGLFLWPIFFFTPFFVYAKRSAASKISDAAVKEWFEGGEARHERRQQNKQGELQALRAGPNGAYFESLRVMRTAYVWDV